MKKIFSIILVIAMSLTMLAGCSTQKSGDSVTNGGDSAAVTKAADQITEAVTDTTGGSAEGKLVGITMPSVGNDFLLALSQGFQRALEAEGCRVQIDSAENDVTTQLTQIENFTTMDADVIVVWAVNGNGVASACKAAMDAGIPVLAFAYEIPGVTTSIISASEESMAVQCVSMTSDWIDKTFADAGDGEVNVFVMTASNTPEAAVRSKILLTIADNPKVKVIAAEVENQDSTDAARTLTENTMLTNPDIDVIIAFGAASAIGAESYISSSSSSIKDKSKFGIFSIDETEEIVAKIKASETNESVLRGTISMGTFDDTINDFMKGITPLITGQTPIERVDGQAYIITPETLAEKE
ncbi:MAG TPA: substrate-binding domain-containing protein [Clostridiales bacterium]|nr:substrate-binding domain-containing protein [Clostridiales bacterium]